MAEVNYAMLTLISDVTNAASDVNRARDDGHPSEEWFADFVERLEAMWADVRLGIKETG